MTASVSAPFAETERVPRPVRAALSLALMPLQPLLGRIVARIAARFPEIFERLGPHRSTRFVIEPTDLHFVLLLRPEPGNLLLRAFPRGQALACDARISGRFIHLLRLIDCDEDGDAMFFSRDLVISGDTEAVVTLRNALDDVDGSIATSIAAMFGPPGRAALAGLRRFGGWSHREAREIP